jgi:thioredoxin 1
MVGPIIDELGTEYDGKVVVGKVDVDARICSKIWCENIPTVLIFHNGEVVGKQLLSKLR